MILLATYTTGEVAAFTAAIVAVLGAFGAMVVTILHGIRDIKQKVNGAHTEAQRENKALQDKVTDLVALLAERKETAALLAQANVSTPQAPAPPMAVTVENSDSNPVPTTLTKPDK